VNEIYQANADAHSCKFIINFIHRNYDAMWDKMKATAPEFFMAWRDCGLVDEKGQARPAFKLWRTWFERTLQE
jgi:hypothetical protein